MSRRIVLNVGGGNKTIPLPPHYAGWEHLLLDVVARDDVDLVCDARDLAAFPGDAYDAIYCSHNLEHYHRHEVQQVLAGFHHVLAADGFCEIRVPDLRSVMQAVLEKSLSLEDQLYHSPAGPISPLDVIYGYHREIETGNPFYAHKTGFTAETLTACMQQAGFTELWTAPPLGVHEVRILAFKQASGAEQRRMLGIPSQEPR